MQERGVRAFAHNAAKSGHQLGSGRAQLVVMMKRQLAENFLPFGSERKQDFAAIVLRRAYDGQIRRLPGGSPAPRRYGGGFACGWPIRESAAAPRPACP